MKRQHPGKSWCRASDHIVAGDRNTASPLARRKQLFSVIDI